MSKEKESIKYQIIWPDIKEEIAESCKDKLIFLEECEKKKITKLDMRKSPENLLIEGDNFPALCVLTATHRNKIDVIYIDPPYNTGNNDFMYNDKFVEKEDPWRHSCWLSFMHKRLYLARELLKETGVIFISVDDNEQAQLKFLCDEVFGENNFIANFIWIKDSGKQRKNVGTCLIKNEYILCYAKDTTKCVALITQAKLPELSNPDNDPRGPWFSANISSPIEREGAKNTFGVKINNKIYQRRWFKEQGIIQKYVDEDKIYIPPTGNVPRLKMFKEDFLNKRNIANNIIEGFSTTDGVEDLEIILGERKFDYPKPVGLIKFLLNLIDSKEIVVLDFFAGSGTTGQAVIELNKEDGGNRQFILVTNNENKICTDVCYPRLKKVIEGYEKQNGEKIEGLGGTLLYFKVKTTKEKMKRTDASLDINKAEVSKKLEDIIKTKEKTHKLLRKHGTNDQLKIFHNPNTYKKCFICFEFDASFKPTDLEKIIKEYITKKILHSSDVLYCPLDYENEKIIIKPIPEDIINEHNNLFGDKGVNK
jgi:adenine-specific DNA-methyltransferase